MHLLFDVNILGSHTWFYLIIFIFIYFFCLSESSFHKSPFFPSIFFLWLIEPADQCHSQYIINYILPDQPWWTGDYSCGSSDWMLLVNLWLCGTTKNETELKGEGQVGNNPNSDFDNCHSCDLRNFPQFLPSSPREHRSKSLISQPSSWAGMLSHQKAAHAEENLLAAPATLALFRGLCVGYGSVSLPHAVLRVFFWPKYKLISLHSSFQFTSALHPSVYFSHFLLMAIFCCSHPDSPCWALDWLSFSFSFCTSLYFSSNFPTDSLCLPLLEEGDRDSAELNQWVFALSLCSHKVNFSPKLIQLLRTPVCCGIDMCS